MVRRTFLRGSPVVASAHEGTARYGTAPDRVHATNPPQEPESQPREQRWVHSSPVELASIGHSPSRTVATPPGTPCLVDPSAFAAALVGCASLRNPTLIPCFHSFRSGQGDKRARDLRSVGGSASAPQQVQQSITQNRGGGLDRKIRCCRREGRALAFGLTLRRLRWAAADRLGSPEVSLPS